MKRMCAAVAILGMLVQVPATAGPLDWPEVSKEQYEAARREVRWETETPKGAKYHVSWFGDDGLHVFDVWDSAEDFNTFVETRLRDDERSPWRRRPRPSRSSPGS